MSPPFLLFVALAEICKAVLFEFLSRGIHFPSRRFLFLCHSNLRNSFVHVQILCALLVDAFHCFNFPIIPLTHSFIHLVAFFPVPRLGKPILRGLKLFETTLKSLWYLKKTCHDEAWDTRSIFILYLASPAPRHNYAWHGHFQLQAYNNESLEMWKMFQKNVTSMYFKNACLKKCDWTMLKKGEKCEK